MMNVSMQKAAWRTLFFLVQGTKPLSRQADEALRAAGKDLMAPAGMELDGEGNISYRNEGLMDVYQQDLSKDAVVGCKIALVSALLGKVGEGGLPSRRDRDIFMTIAGKFGDAFRSRVEKDAPLPAVKDDDDLFKID